jgi:cbb3-type cytochrome oxidase subunit 1
MGNRFLRIAVVYFLAGIALGIVMSASHDFVMRPVHAHVNLLGWVSLTLFGLFYRSVPAAAANRLAKTHFWLYNIALPVQMISLTLFLNGSTAIVPLLGLSAVTLATGVICFAVNLWRYTRD